MFDIAEGPGGLIVLFEVPEVFDVLAHVAEQRGLSAENWPADGLLVVPWSFDDHVLRAAKMTWGRLGRPELNEAITRVGLAEGTDTWAATYEALEGRCEETERAAVAGVIIGLFEHVAQNPTH